MVNIFSISSTHKQQVTILQSDFGIDDEESDSNGDEDEDGALDGEFSN